MVREEMEMHLRHIEACQEEIEWMLDAESRRLEARLRDEAAGMDDDAREQLYDWHQDTHWELTELFPQIIRNSIFVMSYSFLEYGLFRLCMILNQIRPTGIQVEDLRGRPIEQAQAYLTKAQGIAFPADAVQWRRIQRYRELRNVIVHRNGRLHPEPKDQEVRRFIGENPNFAAIDRHVVSLRPAGCRDAIASIRDVLRLVFNTALQHVTQQSRSNS